MAFSVNTPVGDGVTKQFAVNFTNGIFSRDSVSVFVDGELDGAGDQIERDFIWINDGLIELTGTAPANGAKINIRRIMDKQAPAVDFEDGEILNEKNLDLTNDQLLNLIHELLDGYGLSTLQGPINMNGYRITGLADAVEADDAVPRNQAISLIGASSDKIVSTSEKEEFTATAGQTEFVFPTIEYVKNINALIVFVNGVYQLSGADYTETAVDRIEFTTGLESGDLVVIIGARFDAAALVDVGQDQVDAAMIQAGLASDSATEAESSAVAAQNAAGYKLGINTQPGTTYTLVASDEGDLVRMTNASANTVTVPANSSVAFEVGTIVNVRQSGAGTTTIAPDTGVTINAPQDEFTTDGEEFGVALVKVATDEWDLVKSYAGVRNDAFDSDITGAANTSGYQYFPSGLIMQWGYTTISDNANTNVSFPLTFPNSVINVTITPTAPSAPTGEDVVSAHITSINNTGFIAGKSANYGTAGAGGYWFAIGV